MVVPISTLTGENVVTAPGSSLSSWFALPHLLLNLFATSWAQLHCRLPLG
jgi:sulfate adenylyltransferase subunit 1 (EFTu-like GTPase family)